MGVARAGEGREPEPRPLAAGLAALLVFGLCLVTTYADFASSDWRRDVPMPNAADSNEPLVRPVVRADYRLGVWAMSRNASTLARQPTALFDAEPCFPAERTLALHHPVIAPAVVALPGWLLTHDPILSFNVGLFAGVLVSAFAMWLLVADWTGSRAAGVVAGVLFAFHVSQLEHPYHYFTVDNSWLLFGLYFGRRLLEFGRWRDAAGFASSCVLQMSSSFYPFLAAVVLAVPMTVYFGIAQRGRAIAKGPVALAAGGVLVGAALIFTPYLLIEGATLGGRSNVLYAPWLRFAPGGSLFPGWVCLALAGVGLVLPRRTVLPELGRDPRWALAVGALGVAWIATGGNVAAQMAAFQGAEPPRWVLPNLFAALRAVAPGLETVRLPSRLGPGVVQLVALFAGFGAAALLRAVPGSVAGRSGGRAAVATALVAIACLDTLRPAFLGLEPRLRFGALELRPPQATLAFYEGLRARGVRGPLLELPIDRGDKSYSFDRATEQQLLTAYHALRTSGCYSSFIPASVRDLARHDDLGDPGTRSALADLGFETVVVHHPPGDARLQRHAGRVRRAADDSKGALTFLAGNRRLTAYALGPEAPR